MYKIHKDRPAGKWNIFFVNDKKQEEFFMACDTLDEALEFVKTLNGEMR